MKNKGKRNDDPRYHNTELLLKKYRDTVWSIEAATLKARINFELEYDCPIEQFLETAWAAGANLAGTSLEGQMRTIEKNKKMLRILDNAVDLLRRKHKNGEKYYWILYYTYLSDHEPKNVEEIVEKLQEQLHNGDMSWNTYYRKKAEAIDCLSNVLWGCTSRDCLDITEELISNKAKTVDIKLV